MSFEILDKIVSTVGLGIVIYAYLPQIHHLIQAHCSAGISRRAYALWFVASGLLLAHSLMIHDGIFIVLQSVVLILTGLIFVFARRYKNSACSLHRTSPLEAR